MWSFMEWQTSQLWFSYGISVVQTMQLEVIHSIKILILIFPSLSLLWCRQIVAFKNRMRDFPGGPVVKNLPANAGDTGLSPGPGRSHMPQSNQARAPQLLSLCSRAHEPQLLSPWATTTEPTSHNYWARMPQLLKPVHLEPVLHKRSHRNEKPTHHNEE